MINRKHRDNKHAILNAGRDACRHLVNWAGVIIYALTLFRNVHGVWCGYLTSPCVVFRLDSYCYTRERRDILQTELWCWCRWILIPTIGCVIQVGKRDIDDIDQFYSSSLLAWNFFPQKVNSVRFELFVCDIGHDSARFWNHETWVIYYQAVEAL